MRNGKYTIHVMDNGPGNEKGDCKTPYCPYTTILNRLFSSLLPTVDSTGTIAMAPVDLSSRVFLSVATIGKTISEAPVIAH